MRKVIVLEFITLDGVIQGPGGPGEDTNGGFAYSGWQAPYSDEVIGATMNRQMNLPFDLLLGRKPLIFGHRTGRNMQTYGRASCQRPSTSPRIP